MFGFGVIVPCWIRSRIRSGPALFRVVPVGDEPCAYLPPPPDVEGELPGTVLATLGLIDARLEGNLLAGPEVIDVIDEVRRDGREVREVRIGLGQREIGV